MDFRWAVFIALWTFVDPAFHQRVCAAKNGETASLGTAARVLTGTLAALFSASPVTAAGWRAVT